MPDWAMFWILLLSIAVFVLGWTVYLIESERRRERAGRLMWKREYYVLHGRPDPSDAWEEGNLAAWHDGEGAENPYRVPESHVSGEATS